MKSNIIHIRFLFPFLLILISCKTKKATTNNTNQNENVKEGLISKKNLQKEPHASWFNEIYNDYSVDKNTLNQLKKNENWMHTTQVKIFMGTWCSDSQEQVPALLKVFDYLGFKSYTIIGLDENKQSKKGYEEGNNILKVPTIIFIQNRNELNRIIETPINTIEKDMIDILINKNYTPNYSE